MKTICNNHRSALIAASALLAAAPAVAGEADADKPEELIVTARSLEDTLAIQLGQYGQRLELLPLEDIRNGGFVDIPQALEFLVPGVTVTTQAGAFSYANISLQGSRNSDVLWTIDGVRVGNRLYNSTSPADTLPASMVERVEVLKGGQGLFYGTQAVAGVINIVTRPFSDEFDADVLIGTQSNGGVRANGTVRGALGDHRFVAWASHDRSDGFEIYDDYQPNVTDKRRGYKVTSLGGKYGYDFTPELRLNLQYIRTHARLDYPGVNGQNVNDRLQQIMIGRLDYEPSDALQLYLKTYYHQWDTDYGRPGQPWAYWGFKDFGANAMAQARLSRALDMVAGYEFQNYRGQDDVLLIDGKTEQVHALFGQLRTSDGFSSKVRLAAGARYNKAAESESTVWNVSGRYEPSGAFYLETAIGTSFLLPDAQQLYGIDPCCARGNPDLKPEKSFAINLGVGGRIGTLQWLVAGWDRRIDNLITTDRSNPPEGFPGIFVNIDDKVKAQGVEVSLRGPLGDFRYLASYTYSRERARGTNVQIAGRPEHSGKASLSWAPDRLPLGADLSAVYFGPTEATVSGFGVQPFGDYLVANLGAHAYLDPAQKRLRFALRVENLFDARYYTNVASAVRTGSNPSTRFLYHRLGAPRTLHANLSYSF